MIFLYPIKLKGGYMMGYSKERFEECVTEAFEYYKDSFKIRDVEVDGYSVTLIFDSNKHKTTWPSYMTFNGENYKCTVTSPYGSAKPGVVAKRIIELLEES